MSANPAPLSLNLDPEALRPLVAAIVSEILAQLNQVQSPADGRPAYSESEAAELLGLQPWQLRDERRRGRIRASRIVGRRIRYLRSDLEHYLADRRGRNNA